MVIFFHSIPLLILVSFLSSFFLSSDVRKILQNAFDCEDLNEEHKPHLIKNEWLSNERLISWNEGNEGKSKIEQINGHNADTMHGINFIQLFLHQWSINPSWNPEIYRTLTKSWIRME